MGEDYNRILAKSEAFTRDRVDEARERKPRDQTNPALPVILKRDWKREKLAQPLEHVQMREIHDRDELVVKDGVGHAERAVQIAMAPVIATLPQRPAQLVSSAQPLETDSRKSCRTQPLPLFGVS